MVAPDSFQETFEPSIAGFFCRKCEDEGISKFGEQSADSPLNLKSARFICAEKVGPDLIRQSFASGADGILICGCLVGNCESLDDNADVLAHIHRTKMVLKEMGIAPGRIRQEWICAPGGDRVQGILQEFTEQIRNLGPLENQELEALEEEA